MKYTVVIRQPVADNVRSNLEKQLVERFNLNAAQAEKLAARRAGRLMKPTSQARAELLLSVFQSVGAQVMLEEVRDEQEGAPVAFAAPRPAVDDAVLASPQNNPASFADFMPTAPVSVEPDPFATRLVDPQEAMPTWAKRRPDDEAAAFSAAAVSVATPPQAKQIATTDDWADFAGSLGPAGGAPEPEEAVEEEKVRQAPEFLTAVSEDVVASHLPRTSLVKQIRLATLLPLGLAGLLTLGLLSLSFPRLQDNLMQESAATLASTVGSGLNLNNIQVLNNQLEAIAQTPNVGFVRVELPDGRSFVKAREAAQADILKGKLSEWSRAKTAQGRLEVKGVNYYVRQVGFTADSLNRPVLAAAGSSTVTHRVIVGMTGQQQGRNLLTTLLLVLFTTLLGLGLAFLFARRAARQVLDPLERLVRVADAISLGDLTRPVKVERNDEIGDLAQALERMRLSLEAAMDRLRRRKRG